MNQVHFSSKTDEWEIPQALFDRLNALHHFDLDVCALPENAKCQRFFSPEADGLRQEWKGRCWMNPPYGRGIGAWVKKAFETGRGGGAWSACFLPVLIRGGFMITA